MPQINFDSNTILLLTIIFTQGFLAIYFMEMKKAIYQLFGCYKILIDSDEFARYREFKKENREIIKGNGPIKVPKSHFKKNRIVVNDDDAIMKREKSKRGINHD